LQQLVFEILLTSAGKGKREIPGQSCSHYSLESQDRSASSWSKDRLWRVYTAPK